MGPYYDDLDALLLSFNERAPYAPRTHEERRCQGTPGLRLWRLWWFALTLLKRAFAATYAWRKRSTYEIVKPAPQR